MNSAPRPSPALPKRVLFLNDVSFQYGAGLAQARQVEALLSLGIEVGVLAWATGQISLEAVATRPIDPALWLGCREVNQLEGGRKISDETVVAGLLMEVARFNPAVVIAGNLHAARWPFRLLPALAEIGCRVISFLHDGFLYTGRCAYPGSCKLYLTGCDATCPTATQYPALEPALIAGAWQARRDIFGGPRGIEVVANSRWSRKMFRTALPSGRWAETVELGADEFVFTPADKRVARQRLGLPDGKPVVLCAAVNFQEHRKGGPHLREIIAALKDVCTFAAFGHNAHEIPDLVGLGYHLSAPKLAEIYQAADLFVGTATEEAFGQTLMEAQLCGLPVVAFLTGGTPETMRNEITGRLVRNGDTAGMIAVIRRTLQDANFLATAGAQARAFAVGRFSVSAHAERWRAYFSGHPQVTAPPAPPDIAYPPDEKEGSAHLDHPRPSWSTNAGNCGAEFARISTTTAAALPGWPDAEDSFKLFELGFHAGDVILEIGSSGGWSTAVALRGSLANSVRTMRPEYYGVASDATAIARARAAVSATEFGDCCHLIHGGLRDFVRDWAITPTMVLLDGDRPHESLTEDLLTLSGHLPTGTPLLVHGEPSRQRASENSSGPSAPQAWAAAGHGRFMGGFGRCALFLTVNGGR